MKANTTVYIIGPTIGLHQLGIADFNVVEGFLDKQGYESVKPHDLFYDFDHNILSQKEQIVRRTNALLECDVVLVLPNWHSDSYARYEHKVARDHEMQIVRYDQWRRVMKNKAEKRFVPIKSKYGVTRINQVA